MVSWNLWRKAQRCKRLLRQPARPYRSGYIANIQAFGLCRLESDHLAYFRLHCKRGGSKHNGGTDEHKHCKSWHCSFGSILHPFRTELSRIHPALHPMCCGGGDHKERAWFKDTDSRRCDNAVHGGMALRLCGISDRSVIMNTADWIVVILLLLWAVAAAISISKQKKKGKCCGCCSHCHSRCGKK